MKIDNEILSIVNRYKSDPVEKKETASKSGNKTQAATGDRVEISLKSDEIEQLKQTMQGISDVRMDRVASLKKAIDDGTYSVPGNKVAEKMLEYWKTLNVEK
jgi:negative regulator of flagellin synthesis FlgM